MKRKLSVMVSIWMVLGLAMPLCAAWPQTAQAAGAVIEVQDETGFTNALTDPGLSSDSVNTIRLTDDVTLTTEPQLPAGKPLYITSDDGGKVLRASAAMTLNAEADLTFDKLIVAGGGSDEQGASISSIVLYGNGHKITLGKDLKTLGPSAKSFSTIYGGGQPGIVVGSTSVEINSGAVGSVYGGAKGQILHPSDSFITVDNYNDVYTINENTGVRGNTSIKITGGTVGTVYGGGELGIIGGSTSVEITGGTVSDVFGGSLGRGLQEIKNTDPSIESEYKYIGSAAVEGNTSVAISGNAEIGIKIFGGSPHGDAPVYGNTSVTINGNAKAEGYIAGGGWWPIEDENKHNETLVVHGNATVEVGGNAEIRSYIAGIGYSRFATVKGNVNVVIKENAKLLERVRAGSLERNADNGDARLALLGGNIVENGSIFPGYAKTAHAYYVGGAAPHNVVRKLSGDFLGSVSQIDKVELTAGGQPYHYDKNSTSLNTPVVASLPTFLSNYEKLSSNFAGKANLASGTYTYDQNVNSETVTLDVVATIPDMNQRVAFTTGPFGVHCEMQSFASIGEWKEQNGKWTALDTNGNPIKNNWGINTNGALYYFDSNGYMQSKKWIEARDRYGEEHWYYLDKDGRMVTGWKQLDGKWYYLDISDGHMWTGWLESKGKWYWLRNDGSMATGYEQVNKRWSRFSNSGVWQGYAKNTGWKKYAKGWSFRANGSWARNKWLMVNGKWYVFDASGYMRTGWVKSGKSWYWMNASGAMVTGEKKIGGKINRFDTSGKWLGAK